MKSFFSARLYHTLSIAETLRSLETEGKGLSDYDAQGRRDFFGANVLPTHHMPSPLRLFARQFYSPLIAIIGVAALISFYIGHVFDAFFIIFVVLINTTVGFVQEYKAEQALEKLRGAVHHRCRVFRNGRKREIDTTELVPGDIVILVSGDKVPADGRLLRTDALLVDESLLTGEWIPVEKNIETLSQDVEIMERTNMVFSGTMIVGGEGIFAVTATGSGTEIGAIARLIQKQEEQMTPLQKRFLHLSHLLGVSILAFITLFSIVGILRGEKSDEIFLTAVALTVSAIPEGLLSAVTVVLVLGVRRLARRKALVRKLNVSEVMGALTVICMDKTGTVTEGSMSVSHILSGEEALFFGGVQDDKNSAVVRQKETHTKALEIATVLNDAYIENPDDELSEWIIRGRPTDRALLLAGIQSGIDRSAYEKAHPLVSRVPFASEKKYAMRIQKADQSRYEIFLLGAPEEIFNRSRYLAENRKNIVLDDKKIQALQMCVSALTRQGLRVLACAYRSIEEKELAKWRTNKDTENSFHLAGLIALKDPLRHDAQQSVAIAKRGGVRPVIITGDHRNTAVSIVEELGLSVTTASVMEGKDLARLSDRDLEERVDHITVFARVLPEHKIRIIRALQARGEVVAMVGDGVNDAPAIKAADAGIAVGSGTDIAKEVADIVLTDSSFSVVVEAIKQGRLMYENIRRVTFYLIADDFSELFLFFIALALGMPLPLLAVQVLWINLVEDSFPNIALTAEEDTHGLMDAKPRKRDASFFEWPYKKFLLSVFIITGSGAVSVFLIAQNLFADIVQSRTMAFALIAFDSLVFAYIIRSFQKSLFRRDIFSNWILNGAVALSFAILLVGIYVKPMQSFLHTVSLSGAAWSIIVGIAVVEVLLLELSKHHFLARQKSVIQ